MTELKAFKNYSISKKFKSNFHMYTVHICIY